MRGGHRILPRYSAAVLWPRSTITILDMKRMLSTMDRSPTLKDQNSNVRCRSKGDMCSAQRHAGFTRNSDRESGLRQTVMSALPPIADMCGANRNVRFGPIGDITSLDHLVGAGKHCRRNYQAECLGRFEI